MAMTKQELHQEFIIKLQAELDAITAAAKGTISTATSDAHHAEGKYDTFSLESSYLARGQAKRVEELRLAVERLEMLPLKSFDATKPIVLSAWVKLSAGNGETRSIFLGPAAGGESVMDGTERVMMLTSQSPLGQCLLGKHQGESFNIKLGPLEQTFTITSVE
jgi:transcription elongation GreA/GreB family factor